MSDAPAVATTMQHRAAWPPVFPKNLQNFLLAFLLPQPRKSTHMLRRAIAVLLLVLAASPFTAPVETCDIPTLFGAHVPVAQHQGRASSTSPNDQSQAVAFSRSSRRARSRMKISTPFVVDLTRCQTTRGNVDTRRPASGGARTLVLHSSIPLRI